MARIKIDGHLVLSYEHEGYQDIYWNGLSQFIIDKYGKNRYIDNETVESILVDSFGYLIDQFKNLILEETELTFFIYIFYLHEESLKLLKKIRDGLKLTGIDENEFSRYRRVLKLILEQGCDINLKWGEFPTGDEVFRMDEKIQKLFYISTWIYGFADFTAYQKMLGNAKTIEFSEENQISIDWQNHYGAIYNDFFPRIGVDYEKAVFDNEIIGELKSAISNCFKIDYDFAGGIIFEIKKQFSTSNFQTIEPYVLPINLVMNHNIDKSSAECFYNGLSLSRENKMSIENVVLKPYSTERYMFRPILIYQIEGVKRALIGEEKFAESIYVLATNAISWNTIPKDWNDNKCMVRFMSKKGNQHDKLLEDKIEETLIKRKFRFCRNIKSFKRPNQNNLRIDNELAGEIDFIIIDEESKKIIVADSKYNKARYESVGYRADYTNFSEKYEPQLLRKIEWIAENKIILQEHLKIIYQISNYDITEYEVDGLFFINTPTFYMLNGKYKAITLNQIEDYLIGEFNYPTFKYINSKGKEVFIDHPYFK
ncbi:MAG: hypothetical protein KAT33_09565 [Bacteroidales bacterium]|nr:hypothetical protein [Bacteroidales bacterium]